MHIIKTEVKESKIVTLLREQFYTMKSNESSGKNVEPLILSWVNNDESNYHVVLIENIIRVIAYVNQNPCNENVIENMLSQVQLHTHLDKTYELAIVCCLIAVINNGNLADEASMRETASKVLCVLIEGLEQVDKIFDEQQDKAENFKPLNNKPDGAFLDTSKLEVGMVVQKGYPELCDLVGESKYKSGSNQRKAQEKRWKRFINYSKSEFGGRKLIITDIYDEPLPKEDKRNLGNNNIYLKYIENILLRYVNRKNNKECYLTKNQLWLILGMINKNYKKIPYSILKNDIEYCDVKEWELNNFYMRCNSKLNNILYSALNNLQNRSLIVWNTQIMIVVPDNKNGIYCNHYIASDSEIKKILAVERKVLKDMGFESKRHVMCKMKMPQFYEKVNSLLYDLYGWKRKYERIKILFNKNDIKEALQQDDYRLQMMLLNNLIVEAVDKNAQVVVDHRNEKALKEYEERIKDYLGKPPKIDEIDDIFTYPKYFVNIQKRLSQKFLSIKYVEEEEKRKEDIDMEFGHLFKVQG